MRMKWPSSMIPSNRSTSALCTRKLMCIIFIIYLSRYNPNDKHVLYRIFRVIRRFYVSLCISLHEMLCNSLLRQQLFVRPTRNKRKRSRRMVIKAASKGDCNKVKPFESRQFGKVWLWYFMYIYVQILESPVGFSFWFAVHTEPDGIRLGSTSFLHSQHGWTYFLVSPHCNGVDCRLLPCSCLKTASQVFVRSPREKTWKNTLMIQGFFRSQQPSRSEVCRFWLQAHRRGVGQRAWFMTINLHADSPAPWGS